MLTLTVLHYTPLEPVGTPAGYPGPAFSASRICTAAPPRKGVRALTYRPLLATRPSTPPSRKKSVQKPCTGSREQAKHNLNKNQAGKSRFLSGQRQPISVILAQVVLRLSSKACSALGPGTSASSQKTSPAGTLPQAASRLRSQRSHRASTKPRGSFPAMYALQVPMPDLPASRQGCAPDIPRRPIACASRQTAARAAMKPTIF